MGDNKRVSWTQSDSKKKLTPVLIAGAVFAGLMLIGVIANVIRGNYIAIPLVITVVLLATGVVWVGVWLNRRRIQLLFRSPTPDRLIENYHATLAQAKVRKIPYADAAAAHLSAIAAIVYGQFDRARQELATVDWDDTPAMYRRNRLYALALIALLEKQDETRALNLASDAGGLQDDGGTESPSILADAIFVATGDAGADVIKRSERSANRGAGALSALSAWALSLYAGRTGQAEAAERYRAQAREAAPHFVGLKTQA